MTHRLQLFALALIERELRRPVRLTPEQVAHIMQRIVRPEPPPPDWHPTRSREVL